MDNESELIQEEKIHPGDVTAADHKATRRRLLLGLGIALSVNLAFLTGGAKIADYLIKVFHPYFFPYKEKIVYIRMDVSPSPSPSATPTAPPTAR